MLLSVSEQPNSLSRRDLREKHAQCLQSLLLISRSFAMLSSIFLVCVVIYFIFWRRKGPSTRRRIALLHLKGIVDDKCYSICARGSTWCVLELFKICAQCCNCPFHFHIRNDVKYSMNEILRCRGNRVDWLWLGAVLQSRCFSTFHISSSDLLRTLRLIRRCSDFCTGATRNSLFAASLR